MLENSSVRQGSGQKEKPPKGLKWYELFGEAPQVVRVCEDVIVFGSCWSRETYPLPAGVGDQVPALELAKDQPLPKFPGCADKQYRFHFITS